MSPLLPSPIRSVLFDLDGTLLDAFPPIITALNQTLKEFGKPEMTSEAIKRHTGHGGGGIRPLFPDHVEQAGKRFLELHDAIYLKQVQSIEGADALLAFLQKKHIPMAVVTSKGQHRAEAQIELLGWQGYFQTVIGRLDGRPEKPSPIPLQMACDVSGCPTAASLMIGDGIGDMQAGRSAGVFSIGITDSFSKKELEDSGASICFKSLNEVYQWLKTVIV